MGYEFRRGGIYDDTRQPDSCYDTAQICLDGHIISKTTKRNPESKEDYCHTCGKETITECLQCSTGIRGSYYINGSAAYSYSLPNHCYSCGEPFPWTTLHIKLIEELVDELDLDNNDKETLRNEAKHIVCSTQRTTLARHKCKRILSSLSDEAREMFKRLLTSIGTENINEIIPGG